MRKNGAWKTQLKENNQKLINSICVNRKIPKCLSVL